MRQISALPRNSLQVALAWINQKTMNILWGVPYFVWLVICLLIAVAYLIFTPKQVHSTFLSREERFILKYAHSIVWLLLAMACIFASFERLKEAKVIGLAALFTYIVFMFTLFKIKIKDKKSKAAH